MYWPLWNEGLKDGLKLPVVRFVRRVTETPQGSRVRTILKLQCLGCSWVLADERNPPFPVARTDIARLRDVLVFISQDVGIRRA